MPTPTRTECETISLQNSNTLTRRDADFECLKDKS